ncbi:hypothetical protein [Pararhizobium sp. DWP1-1-3]|uniref:hypothetical protein n=1 Tax=Pararhizobium sp. DWP1-1-3 TaxID=2804652 RepID=UPI003CF7D197
MTHVPFETSAGNSMPKLVSPRIYYPIATVKCVGNPVFRTQAARDFACLLDVDPNVDRWTCDGVEVVSGGGSYRTDFLATSSEGKTFLVEVDEHHPSPPAWLPLAARRAGHEYRPVSAQEFADSIRLQNAKDLLRYGFHRCPLGDRIRLLATLDEMTSLTVAEALSVFREGRPMGCLAALVLQGFLEIDLDAALIGPDTTVRRIRD